MNHMMFVAALSVAVFGCKKGGGGDCDKAVAHSMDLSKDQMSKMPGVDDKMMKKMVDTGVSHCKSDKWSDDAVKCMADSKAMADSQACYDKLTQDQRDKMQKAAMELMKDSMPKMAEPPPAPAPAPAGSDSGSAAAPAGSAQ